MFSFRRNKKSRKSRPAAPARKFVRRLPLSLEVLEDRILLSADNWIAGSGNWNVGSNWSLNHAPGTGDTAIINTPSAATVTIQSSDNISVQNVTTASTDTLSFTGGSLTVTSGNSTLSGALSMTAGTLTANGSGVNLTANGSTTVSGASLYAVSGATLSLPKMTSYIADNNIFQANGSGSVLDVSALTTPTLKNNWHLQAQSGGELKLTGLTSLSSTSAGTIFIDDDTGSSTLLDSNVTTLTGVQANIANDTQVANSWKQFTNGTLTVSGGSYNLAGLTDVDGSDLYAVNGGSLALPGLVSYTADNNIFQAFGSGSVLDVSALTTPTLKNNWHLQAQSGGELKLTGLTSLSSTSAGTIFIDDDIGSSTLLDSNVTTLAGVQANIANDAQVANSWVAFTNGTLSITGGSLNFANLTSFTGGTLSVTGGSATFPKLRDVSNSKLQLSGGATASFAVLTTGKIALNNGTSATIQGTTISMPLDGTSGATINVPSSSGLTIILDNSGTKGLTDTTFNVGQGSNVVLAGGTYLGTTTFNVAQGATVDLTGGTNTTYGGLLTGSGAGTVGFGSARVAPALGGLTLNFPGSMFQWTGGYLDTVVGDVTNEGTLNLAGPNDKAVIQDGKLDNKGTIIQTGSGNFGLHGDNVSPTTLINEAGASYLIEGDGGFDNPFGNQVAVQNAGTIKKTAGTGTSQLYINGPLSNTGTIEADSGTLYLDAKSISQIANNALTAGTWNALNGASLEFPSGTSIATNQANISIVGSGANITGLGGLSSNSGTLTIGDGSTLTLSGNFAQTSSGTLNDQIDTNSGSGLIAISGTATLAGNLNVDLPTGFTPNRNAIYPVMSFASASGTFATVTGLGSYLTEQINNTGVDLTNGTGTPVSLKLSQVTAPTTATTGQQITVNWTVKNSGSTATTSNWQDSVYLSTTQSITGSSILLGSVTHSGGLAANSSYNAGLTAALPALPPGNYYVLVRTDSLDQVLVVNRASDTLAASTGQLAVSVPALTLATPANGTFTAADQDQYYQITVPAGGSLQVSLTSAASSGALALYVSQGTQPAPYSFQEAATLAGQPNQSLTVPIPGAGTYYILVHSVSGAAATAGYTLTVTQTNSLSVSAISPYSGGNAGNVTIEIDGTNFTPQTTASLTLGSTTIHATAIDFVSASTLFATFNLSSATAGGYALSVQQGTESATAGTPFQVVASTQSNGLLDIKLDMPQFIRAGRTGTIVITYTNTSDNDIIAPLLNITSTNPNVFFSMPDDANNYVRTAQVLAVAPSGPAGILRPGQSGQLTLTHLTEGTGGEQIPVAVRQMLTDTTIDWTSQKNALQPIAFSHSGWNVIWSNLMATVGTTTDSYQAALASAATYLGNLGDTTAEVSDINRLWSFLVAQANGAFPPATLASTIDASLPVPGSLSLSIRRVFRSTIAERYQNSIFGMGWVSNWQVSLSADPASGNVFINTGDALSYFARQPNGNYLVTDGEYGTLSQSDGVYTFTSPNGTQYVFLANGNLNYEQDTNGNRITLGYNTQNQIVTLTYSNPADPSEPTEKLALVYYTAGPNTGLVQSLTDGSGNTWSYNYDGADHLISVIGPGTGTSGNPGTLTTKYSYDASGNPETANALLTETKTDGSQINDTYDRNTGRLTGTSQTGNADPSTYSYPGEGEVTVTDSAHNQATAWYNDLGLPARFEDPLGHISSYIYDANGNRVSYTDASGNTYQYSYDANGNLTQVVNPLGQTVNMTYGPLSKLTSITDGAGNTTQYQYSAAGNLLSIIYPDAKQQSFNGYDPLGNFSEMVLQNSDAISYLYYPSGLVKQETLADGTYETFEYDTHCNLTTAKTHNAAGALTGTTSLTYNAANELLSITYPNGQYLKFTYNPATGQRTQSVDQDGYTINYIYDPLGRLYELKDGKGNPIVQYNYNNIGQLQNKINGNRTSTNYGYDKAGNLTSILNYAPDGKTINSSFTYERNALGQVIKVTDNAGNVTQYGYDALGQLTQVTLPNGASITYVYNAAGDRIEVRSNGTATNYIPNADNEITQVGATAYTYDDNGNLHTVKDTSGTTAYTYNDLNQLVSITNPDGSVQSFQYSPLGFMVGTSTTSAGGTNQTNYLVDPIGLSNVVSSYNGSGSLIAHYNYGLGLVSQTGPNGTGYYDFDVSGNTVGITGSNGTYVNQYSYLPFGETKAISATLPNPFTFAGQVGVMQIGNNLFYMRARGYTPATGQFLSNDPAGLAGGQVNLRQYVANSPLNLVDPSGYDPNGDAQSDWENWWKDIWTPDNGRPKPKPEPEPEPKPSPQPGGEGGGDHGGEDGGDHGSEGGGEPGGGGGDPGGGTDHGGGDGGGGDGSGGAGGGTPGGEPGSDTKGGGSSIASHDPNALYGPAGKGLYVLPGTLTYTLAFENDGTAPAQTVTASEQLDANLDWSTFQFGSFGFGSEKIVIPAGLTQYQTTISYQNTDGTSLDVNVDLNFNVQTGLLTVTFTSIDPTTGQAPAGVFDGFLPPDNSSGIGEGFVQYTVQPKSGLPSGAAIGGQASVVFDTNAAIQTNTVTNTIDATPPTSTVNPLPATVNSPSFNVSWSGSDPNGPGIASYSIYVSDNGAPFTLWLTNTTQTSATYTGQVGHHYSFYSVAIDQLGLTQPTPSGAQATTYVWVPPPPPPAPPPAPPAPPTLQVPPLLAFIDSILGGIETINGNGTETITDSIFGIPLFVSTFDNSGNLVSVDLFGIDVTFLF